MAQSPAAAAVQRLEKVVQPPCRLRRKPALLRRFLQVRHQPCSQLTSFGVREMLCKPYDTNWYLPCICRATAIALFSDKQIDSKPSNR